LLNRSFHDTTYGAVNFGQAHGVFCRTSKVTDHHLPKAWRSGRVRIKWKLEARKNVEKKISLNMELADIVRRQIVGARVCGSPDSRVQKQVPTVAVHRIIKTT
jgi:hypothetical protein